MVSPMKISHFLNRKNVEIPFCRIGSRYSASAAHRKKEENFAAVIWRNLVPVFTPDLFSPYNLHDEPRVDVTYLAHTNVPHFV